MHTSEILTSDPYSIKGLVFFSYVGNENCYIEVNKYQQLPDEIVFELRILTEDGVRAPHLFNQLTHDDRIRLLNEYEVFFK
jgi:hypothetical protein